MTDNNNNKDINKEIEAANARAEEYLNNWKRAQADFINYKKDEARRLEEFLKFADQTVITEMLDVADSLERTLNETPPETRKGQAEWFKGLAGTQKQLNHILEKRGIEKIEFEGEFDPNLHEITETAGSGAEESYQEVRTGYKLRGRVVRPTRLKAVKK